MSLWLLCRAAGGSETRRYLFSRRLVLRQAPTVISNLRKQTSGHRVETKPRVAAEVDSGGCWCVESFWYFGPRRWRWAIGRKRPTSVPSETCPFLLADAHMTGELESRAVVSNSLRMQSVEFSRPEHWGNCSVSHLQGIFPTQGSNLGLPHCGRVLYHLSHKGEVPRILEWVAYPFCSNSSRSRNRTGVSCVALRCRRILYSN